MIPAQEPKGADGSAPGVASSAIAQGMHRQGFDISLTQYDERGWRATFYVGGMKHSPTGATGSAREPTATRAVQRAAWEALTQRCGKSASNLGGSA